MSTNHTDAGTTPVNPTANLLNNDGSPQENPFEARAKEEAAAAEAKKPASIMDLVTERRRKRPVIGVLAGGPGLGKSTLLTDLPEPLYFPIERGLDHIHVRKLPRPGTYAEFLELLNMFIEQKPKGVKSIVIDTADALEQLLWKQICEQGAVSSIEFYAGGYGKGYIRAKEIWRDLMDQLIELSERVNVWLICHSHIRSINDPILGTTYDTYELKLQNKVVETLRESVDCILFGKLESVVTKDSPTAKKGRNVITEDRVLYCTPTTGVEAKNRFGFPRTIKFSYAAITAALDEFYNKK